MLDWLGLGSPATGDTTAAADSDGFCVRPERVTALSQTLSGKQDAPVQMASDAMGAVTVDTGDPALDRTVQQAVQRLSAWLIQFGQALGQDARQLSDNASTYRRCDQQGGGMLDEITSTLSGPAAGATQQGGAGLAASGSGIAGMLNGQ
jgi:hypothetical protein